MNEKEYIKRFENLSLPADKFNHKGHLWLGWLYIRDHGLGVASEKLNSGIKKFAESLGAGMKFHYTLTTTFACAIKSRFKKDQTFEDFLEVNQDFVDDAMKLIGTHYSQELLATEEARVGLVAPDKEPFPKEFEIEIGLTKSL